MILPVAVGCGETKKHEILFITILKGPRVMVNGGSRGLKQRVPQPLISPFSYSFREKLIK